MYLVINIFKIICGLEWKKNNVKKILYFVYEKWIFKKIYDGELV